MADTRTPEERQHDLAGIETASQLVGIEELERLRTAESRAEYLQREINKMRRVMQDAGTWDQFCTDYAAYENVREQKA